MQKIFENKFAIIVITLLIGGLIGWLIKPAPTQMISEEGHDHALENLTNQLWTCSMHPQVKLGEPGDCPLCGMDLIPVSTSSGSSNPMAYEMTPEAVAMAQIHTTKIGGVNGAGELFLTGKIQADERENASVTAKYPAESSACLSALPARKSKQDSDWPHFIPLSYFPRSRNF
ncbi:heavy metal-binding domain-containing protein [Algoriphagus boritolerans]|uniref:heavy metal-binding domain-containing protein n=1 Tax=Algoriphagus boritolerans TaxID=308111 RepID=UPI000AE5D3D1